MKRSHGKEVLGALALNPAPATGAAGASTCHASSGKITTEGLTTAAGSTFTETITNNQVAATDMVFASVATAGTGEPVVANVTPGPGSIVVIVRNNHAADAFNAALVISFVVFKAS